MLSSYHRLATAGPGSPTYPPGRPSQAEPSAWGLTAGSEVRVQQEMAVPHSPPPPPPCPPPPLVPDLLPGPLRLRGAQHSPPPDRAAAAVGSQRCRRSRAGYRDTGCPPCSTASPRPAAAVYRSRSRSTTALTQPHHRLPARRSAAAF